MGSRPHTKLNEALTDYLTTLYQMLMDRNERMVKVIVNDSEYPKNLHYFVRINISGIHKSIKNFSFRPGNSHQSVEGKIILKWMLNCVNLIRLTQDRVQWLDLVNTAINLLVPQCAASFLTR
jgi:hypothetical protein